MIAVGGGLDPDDQDCGEPKAKPRDKNTVEPVFFHALPESFYTELLTAIPLMAVLGLTAGDSALAVSAYKRGIVFVGVTISDAHNPLLMQHIEKTIWQKHVRRHRPAV